MSPSARIGRATWAPLALLLGCASPERPADGDVSWPTDPRPDAPRPEAADLAAAPDRAWLPTATAMLARAREHVELSAYLVVDTGSVSAVLDGVLDAVDRGVTCRVLADGAEQATLEALARLDAGGCETRLDAPGTTTHTKLLLVDDEALLGSHNLTDAALRRNVEASVWLGRPAPVADLRRAFDDLWSSSAAPPPLGAPARDGVRVVAHREVLPALLACLDGARTRVDVMLYAIAWDDRYPGSEVDQLLLALEAAHARGVDVRVRVDGSPWSVVHGIDDAALARLAAAGVPARRTPAETVHHAKVLACDDTVIVSDANWSYSGLALYNGLSVVLDGALVPEWTAWLDALWQTASPP